MEYDKDLLQEFANEIIDFIIDCKQRIDKIERLGEMLVNSKK